MPNLRPEQLDVTTGSTDNDTVSTKGYVDDSSGGVNVLFNAELSSTQSNVTGDGSNYDITCDTEIRDIGNDYDNTTGVFTTPSDGTYLFNAQISLVVLSASHTGGFFAFIINAGTDNVRAREMNFANGRSLVSNRYVFTDTFIVDLSTNDTVSINIRVDSGALTVGVAASPPQTTFFSGYKIA